MKLFVISDIHGATKPVEQAAPFIRDADLVVLCGDITRKKSRAEAEDVIACLEQYAENIVAVHGNWDRPEVQEYLEEKGFGLHGKGRVINGIGFFGVGGSSPTPIRTATTYSEEEIARILKSGYEQASHVSPVVLVSHTPPRRVRDRSFIGLRGGSHSVRAFLEAHPIDLCLCGHIHEAHGIERFRNSVVVNSGSFRKGRFATVEIGTDIAVTPGRLNNRLHPARP